MDIHIDASSLLRWAGILEGFPQTNRSAIAAALNQLGDGIVNEVAANYAEATGLDPGDVRAQILTQEARANGLHWSMDASALKLTASDWSKPWSVTTDQTFEQSVLLSIVTADDCACPVCMEAAANGPYTPDQIQALAAKWADYVPPATVQGERTNLLHPNCRCQTMAFQSFRRQTVTTFTRHAAPPELMTMKQLGAKVADALSGQIKIAIRANLPK